jgi:FkbM family methyltransferase
MLLRLLRRAFCGRAAKPPAALPRVLDHVRGVVHVGANTGQERDLYEFYGLDVLWIEPIPEVFESLSAHIRGYARQRALRYLLTDRTGVEYAFHVASNGGQSSSILELGRHREMWPSVHYERTIALESATFDWMVEHERIDLDRYDMLLLDTQGSELLVLRGASAHLSAFRFVQTEVADFEAYTGGCTLAELAAFLGERGFAECGRTLIEEHPGGGAYYDVLYERAGCARAA